MTPLLTQSALKFGKFLENDCLIRVSTTGFIKTANDEEVHAIIGNELGYLYQPGSWKFWFPMVNLRSKHDKLIFKEYDNGKILQHFNCNEEQFKLFSVLDGRFFSDTDEKMVRS